MAFKRIRVSSDDITYHTLPGNTGDLNNDAGTLDDSIFGQPYESMEVGLITWGVQANALYKGFPGYTADVFITGTPTAFTVDEPMTLVSGKTYQVTDATKNIFYRGTPIVFEDNNVVVAANNIESVDYLFGRVTFASGYTVTGPITIQSGEYLPRTQIVGYRSFTLTQSANAVDNTEIPVAQTNGGRKTFQYGLKTVNINLTGVYKAANNFRTILEARDEVILMINPDGDNKSVARGYFKFTKQSQSGKHGELEEEQITLNLNVPDQSQGNAAGDSIVPFKWLHENTPTLNTGVQLLLQAFLDSTGIFVQYLPDGTNGVKGEAIVTDVSLSTGLEAMNEFSVQLQGNGALTAVP